MGRFLVLWALVLCLSGVAVAQNVQSSPPSLPLSTALGGTGNATGQPSGSAGGDLVGTFPSPTAKGMARVLCSIRSANMNITTDQACTPAAAITKFTVTAILVLNASTSLTTAAGGMYPAATKGGTPLVAAIQVYSALTAANIILTLTLAGTVAATPYTSAVFFSLTSGQGSAATADVYVIGFDLT